MRPKAKEAKEKYLQFKDLLKSTRGIDRILPADLRQAAANGQPLVVINGVDRNGERVLTYDGKQYRVGDEIVLANRPNDRKLIAQNYFSLSANYAAGKKTVQLEHVDRTKLEPAEHRLSNAEKNLAHAEADAAAAKEALRLAQGAAAAAKKEIDYHSQAIIDIVSDFVD